MNNKKAHTPGHDTSGYRIPIPINVKITPQALASSQLGNNLLSVRQQSGSNALLGHPNFGTGIFNKRLRSQS